MADALLGIITSFLGVPSSYQPSPIQRVYSGEADPTGQEHRHNKPIWAWHFFIRGTGSEVGTWSIQISTNRIRTNRTTGLKKLQLWDNIFTHSKMNATKSNGVALPLDWYEDMRPKLLWFYCFWPEPEHLWVVYDFRACLGPFSYMR